MSKPGLRIRYLGFYGPNRSPAALEFGPGLNVIYGASETGKSFMVESLDFMLGGKPPLRDIPQRTGYDRILLGIETLNGEQFTLLRSTDGGAFRLYSGLHSYPPADTVESRELADHHNEKNSNNLSAFLLEKCDLSGKRIRRNKQGETNSLSFRNIARLIVVNETEIIEQRSPLSDGNLVADTPNFATFKLLLTDVDDTALATFNVRVMLVADQSREAQLELLDQLLSDYRERLREVTSSPRELDAQLEKLETALSQHQRSLAGTEAEYRELVRRRRELRNALEEGRHRRSEVAELLVRFDLLERHYVSDLARLRGIEEGGTLFEVLGQSPCPLCGALPADHRKDQDCDGNIEAVVAAARNEIGKIQLLRTELGETVQGLKRDATNFDRKLPRIARDLEGVSGELEQLVSPRLTAMRATYSDLADKRGNVKEALAMYRNIQDVEERRSKIENRPQDPGSSSVSDGDLQTAVADAFAKQVEAILTAWHFPEADRVHFDPKARDLVIAGKARGARGKGLRAITHAAFTIGLLDYCKEHDTPHPSFVILDSPLLAYRAPESSDDDLSGTDLDNQFYNYLAGLPDDRQVIIVENIDPPTQIKERRQVTMFSKNPYSGRYGFFPQEAPRLLPEYIPSGEEPV
jgi:hypothetical protein